MIKPIKISAVSYLNTKPFLYGLERSSVAKQIELKLDIPSTCAQKLIDGEVDLGLIPVAVIPKVPNAHIITDYCIGTEGEVKTVCLYSQVPIHKVKRLYLDYQSRTSVALTKYLIKNYWKINPQFIAAEKGYESQIKGTTAALIIGDRTIGLEDQYPFVYDLGTAWKAMTGLPFVFAAWVSNRKLPKSFIQNFNQALQLGIANRDKVAAVFQTVVEGDFSIYDYYYRYINYELDAPKKKALQLFLNHIAPRQLVKV